MAREESCTDTHQRGISRREFLKAATATVTAGLLAGCGCAQPLAATPLGASEVIKESFHSDALDKKMKLNVYLPRGYSDAVKYPVLYILHGYTSNEDIWMYELGARKRADELIDRGEMTPVIIVTPHIDNSFGVNTSERHERLGDDPADALYVGMYEDYIYRDVISFVESGYSTIASRNGRYIGGDSMGGFAALHVAFRHEDMFNKVGAFQPALWLDGVPPGLGEILYPNEEIRKKRDPLQLAQDRDLAGLEVYLDCGDEDGYRFYEGAEKLYDILRDKGVQVEYHLTAGAHDAERLRVHMPNYLLFFAGK